MLQGCRIGQKVDRTSTNYQRTEHQERDDLAGMLKHRNRLRVAEARAIKKQADSMTTGPAGDP